MRRTFPSALALAFSVAPVLVGFAGPVSAATDVAFIGPSGWSHVDTGQTDPNRKIDQWHIAGDVASVTYIKDSATAYADALALIKANFANNKIKPSADKDFPCQGKTAHVVEFATGPDGHQILINRMLVPDGAGVDTITYVRSSDSAFDSDVKKSETTFCAPAP
jgi:hypothetical protein